MKKMTIVALAAMLSASMALAGMGISWANGGWMVAHDGDLNEGPGAADNNAVLWQMIYAGANEVADDVDLTNAANGYVSNDDEVIVSRLVPQNGGTADDGTIWDTWLQMGEGGASTVYVGDAFEHLVVYQRLFEGDIPAAGMWYFDSELFTYNASYESGSAPDVFEFDPGYAGVKFDKQLPSTPEIPEPATMSLLGLGALAMVIRRKLRK